MPVNSVTYVSSQGVTHVAALDRSEEGVWHRLACQPPAPEWSQAVHWRRSGPRVDADASAAHSAPKPGRRVVMELVVSPHGIVRCVYSEDLDLRALGMPQIRRASLVEPDNAGLWWADLSPVNGPTLGPFEHRGDALAAEVGWLSKHWLACPEQFSNPRSLNEGHDRPDCDLDFVGTGGLPGSALRGWSRAGSTLSERNLQQCERRACSS